MATEELDALEAEFTAEEEEALDRGTAITPYERLDTWQGILSDPAKAIAAFGGVAIDALAIQFDDGRGKQHFALTAEGTKAVLAKAGRPYRIHKPEFEEFEVDGQPWVRCIATVTLLDDLSEVCDISERPRKDRYGKPDKFAGRAAFTSALARVARTICAGTVGMLEAFFTACMAEGRVIVPGEAPEAIRVEANRAQAGRADERLAERPRIGKDVARELQDRMNALYRQDKARFGSLGRDLEALKTRLTGGPLKLEKLPTEHLSRVEEWLAAKERELADANALRADGVEAESTDLFAHAGVAQGGEDETDSESATVQAEGR
jgi:hypothetical protein